MRPLSLSNQYYELMEKNPLGQYFTPFPVAELMTSLLTSVGAGSVVEPSAGEGVFIKALSELGFNKVIPIEIDQRLALSFSPPMLCTSYLEWQPTTSVHAVIGNPPYIRWKNLSTNQREEVGRLAAWGSLLNSHTDYLMAFIWKAIEDLEPGGQLIFITPDYWTKTAHARNIREYLLEQGGFTHIIAFEEAKIFKGVTGSFIIFRWVKSQPATVIKLFRYTGPNAINKLNKLDIQSTDFTATEIAPFNGGAPWSLAGGEASRYSDEFEKWCSRPTGLFDERLVSRLGDAVSIANGMVTGLDKAFAITDDMRKVLAPNETRAITNVVKGRDLMPLIATRTRPYISIDPTLSPAHFEAEFPTIVEWLEPFRAQLEKRYSYKNAPHYWNWSFRRSLDFHTSYQPKIVVPCKERITNK
jgi:adenine-specific DNA-methyltransferase